MLSSYQNRWRLRKLTANLWQQRREQRGQLALAQYNEGTLPTMEVITKDTDGNGLTWKQLPFYTETRLYVYDPDTPINPADLAFHVVKPRDRYPYPKMDYAQALDDLEGWLQSILQNHMEVKRTCMECLRVKLP